MGRSTSFVTAGPPLSSAGAEDQVRLEEDPRWQVAERIAASKGFAKSKFLTHFLIYICEKYLLEQTDEITEQRIGEHVFRVPQDTTPGKIISFATMPVCCGGGLKNILRAKARMKRFASSFRAADMFPYFSRKAKSSEKTSRNPLPLAQRISTLRRCLIDCSRPKLATEHRWLVLPGYLPLSARYCSPHLFCRSFTTYAVSRRKASPTISGAFSSVQLETPW
jgi:hypothetical protein